MKALKIQLLGKNNCEMNGTKRALLDTNVIIFASKNLIDIEQLLLEYEEFYVSLVTFMEVYGFAFTKEEEKELVDELFENLEVVEINTAIANKVVIYRREGSKKIKLPDAIILATADFIGADLVTDDWDDFKGIDDSVTVRNIDDLKI